jgi:hypothetical protein
MWIDPSPGLPCQPSRTLKLRPALAQTGNYHRFGLLRGTDRCHAFKQLSSIG